jgi:hypothetical protein
MAGSVLRATRTPSSSLPGDGRQGSQTRSACISCASRMLSLALVLSFRRRHNSYPIAQGLTREGREGHHPRGGGGGDHSAGLIARLTSSWRPRAAHDQMRIFIAHLAYALPNRPADRQDSWESLPPDRQVIWQCTEHTKQPSVGEAQAGDEG